MAKHAPYPETPTERTLRESVLAAVRFHGYKKSDLAEKLSVQNSWVTAALGEPPRHGIHPRYLDKLAQTLHLSPLDLMRGPDHVRQTLERSSASQSPAGDDDAVAPGVLEERNALRRALADIGALAAQLSVDPFDRSGFRSLAADEAGARRRGGSPRKKTVAVR